MVFSDFIKTLRGLLTVQTLRQFCIYVVGGVGSIVIDLLVLWGLLHIGLADLISVTLAFIFGMVFNYLFHAKVTFNGNRSVSSLIRYLTGVAVNYVLTVVVIIFGQYIFGLETIIGKIISLPLVAVNGYLLSRYWIFNEPSES